jgi:hypothetical protein
MITVDTLNKVEAYVNAHATTTAPLSPLRIATGVQLDLVTVNTALRTLLQDKALCATNAYGQTCFYPGIKRGGVISEPVPEPSEYVEDVEEEEKEKAAPDRTPGCRYCDKVLPTPGRTRQHEVVCGKNPNRHGRKVKGKAPKTIIEPTGNISASGVDGNVTVDWNASNVTSVPHRDFVITASLARDIPNPSKAQGDTFEALVEIVKRLRRICLHEDFLCDVSIESGRVDGRNGAFYATVVIRSNGVHP